MGSGEASISRSLCPHCNHLESSQGEFQTSERGCVTLVDNETHTEWPTFVDLQLESFAVDGEKHNKGLILVCDDEESERIVKLMGKIFLMILTIMNKLNRMVQFILVDQDDGSLSDLIVHSASTKLIDSESPSLLDIDGFRASGADNDSPIYGEGYVWNLNIPNVKATLYPHRGGFEFMWKRITGDITLEILRDPLSTSEGGCIISHPPCIRKNPTHHSISSVISEDVAKVSACIQFSIQFAT
ncbi:hypothetical protein RDI58_001168 [Solanum bulbocastanum]|uniref:Uncharacterized protein n=1 Tax=Solanum bulbocastanum TaxID=147425 RepID=A0AAN8YPV1_SOLBU